MNKEMESDMTAIASGLGFMHETLNPKPQILLGWSGILATYLQA